MFSCKMLLAADYFSRIRPSDIGGAYYVLADNVLIFSGIIILGILLCVAAVYAWQAHRNAVKSIMKIFLACLGIYVVLAIGNGVYYYLKHRMPSSTENANSVQSVSTSPARTETHSQGSGSDAWAAYPAPQRNVSGQADNDWLVAATNNPSYSIYDLMYHGGLTPENTQFLSEKEYLQSRWVRDHYAPKELHRAYKKLVSAWRAFMRCRNADISSEEVEKYMIHYDMFDIDKPRIEDAANPQLIKDLQRIPLQGIAE